MTETAKLEALAALLWKAEAQDVGAPPSVAAGRTPEAFVDASDATRETWLKFARVALSSLSPPTGGWKDAKPDGLEAAIADFKAKLPGWWFSVGECQVSCDASCAPTVESEHIGLIQHSDDPFDSGFHADLRQPSTLAEAMRTVTRDALAEIEARTALTKKEGQ